jgi:3-oxoacyl-[acyl-carrier-protein] synthase-3
MEESTRRCAEAAGWSLRDIDLFIPHQANRRIIDAVGERLDLAPEKVYVNIDRYGNTSSASIPIALDECVRAGRLKPGDKLALAAFGGGATWGGTSMTWTLPVARATSAKATRGAVREAVS